MDVFPMFLLLFLVFYHDSKHIAITEDAVVLYHIIPGISMPIRSYSGYSQSHWVLSEMADMQYIMS